MCCSVYKCVAVCCSVWCIEWKTQRRQKSTAWRRQKSTHYVAYGNVIRITYLSDMYVDIYILYNEWWVTRRMHHWWCTVWSRSDAYNEWCIQWVMHRIKYQSCVLVCITPASHSDAYNQVSVMRPTIHEWRMKHQGYIQLITRTHVMSRLFTWWVLMRRLFTHDSIACVRRV